MSLKIQFGFLFDGGKRAKEERVGSISEIKHHMDGKEKEKKRGKRNGKISLRNHVSCTIAQYIALYFFKAFRRSKIREENSNK